MTTRVTIAFALLLALLPLRGATPAERIAFNAAVRAFEDQLFERAENQFADFIETFPESDLTASAQAFGMRSQAHKQAEQKAYGAAAITFRQLRIEFPNSPNFLEFVLGEAWNEYHQGNRDAVAELLGDPDGPFQVAAPIRPTDPIALPLRVSGQLLLAQTQLDIGAFSAAKATLENVTDWDLRSEFDWHRRMIMTRLFLADGELVEARQNANDLMELATATGVRQWIAESAAVLGEVLEANNQPEAAIVAYQHNLEPSTPPDRHREAWFKVIELNLEQRDAQTVIGVVRDFIEAEPEDRSLDIALLTLGELHLQRFYEENTLPERVDKPEIPTPADHLNDSRVALERLTKDFPNSPLFAKAQYHRGWCYWELSETTESVNAFQIAVDQLPQGLEAAFARFKLADGHYVLGQYSKALQNYQQITATYLEDPRIRESFLDQVLYQTVRASVAANDMEAAKEAIRNLIAHYPDSLLANTSRLLVGQHMIHIQKVFEAREVLYEMIEHFTEFPLQPEVDYAIAYTFELEGDWAAAARLYGSWLEEYPDHANAPRAGYALAWCTSQQGKADEAWTLFRAFLKDHPSHPLANVAHLWIGNYYFNQAKFEIAERQYAIIIRSDPPAAPELKHRSVLMAARARFRLGQYPHAIRYLSALSDEVAKEDSVSAQMKAEVELNLGDAYFELGRKEVSQKTEEIGQARLRYSRVSTLHAENRLAAVAWGRYGDASYFLKDYSEAAKAYQEVIDHAKADIAIRSQAEVALGMVYERLAEGAQGAAAPEADALWNQALQRYLNVVYLKNLRPNELPDPFWLEEAGIKAGLLVEAQQDIETGIKLYRRLAELLPPLRDDWDRLRLDLEARHVPDA